MQDFHEKLDKLYDAGDGDAIEKFILDAISSAEERSFELAALYNELAGLYKITGRLTDSEKAFAVSLETFESGDFEATSEYITVLINLVGLHRVKGDFAQALVTFRKALSIMRRYFGETAELAECKRDISEVYLLLGDVPSAVTELKEASSLMQKLDGFSDDTIIEVRLKLEQLLATRGESSS